MATEEEYQGIKLGEMNKSLVVKLAADKFIDDFVRLFNIIKYKKSGFWEDIKNILGIKKYEILTADNLKAVLMGILNNPLLNLRKIDTLQHFLLKKFDYRGENPEVTNQLSKLRESQTIFIWYFVSLIRADLQTLQRQGHILRLEMLNNEVES